MLMAFCEARPHSMMPAAMGRDSIWCDDFSGLSAAASQKVHAMLIRLAFVNSVLIKPALTEINSTALARFALIDWAAMPTRQKVTTGSRT